MPITRKWRDAVRALGTRLKDGPAGHQHQGATPPATPSDQVTRTKPRDLYPNKPLRF